jgi:hypothetical protein
MQAGVTFEQRCSRHHVQALPALEQRQQYRVCVAISVASHV